MRLRDIRTCSFLFVCLFIWLFACMALFQMIYSETREKTISELNSRQAILAQQAQAGIEEFFSRMTRVLNQVARSPEVAAMSPQGEKEMAYTLSLCPGEIAAITRLDSRGRIIYTAPFKENVLGRNLSGQPHVQKILAKRQTVVSDVFMAVQGYRAVALHVPVFSDGEFAGSLAVLIRFYDLAKRFLEGIRLGETGYAWMTSAEGIELYCPVPGHAGQSVFENCREFAGILAMAKEMVRGRAGITSYTYDRIRSETRPLLKKHAVYQPVTLADTFWTIVVASSEDDLMASLVSFRNKLIMVGALMLAGCIGLGYCLMRFRGLVQGEAERKKAEQSLQASHQRFLTVLNSIDATIYVADLNTHEILFMNAHMVSSFGRDFTGEKCWESFRGETGPCPACTNARLVDEEGVPTGVYTWQDQNPVTGKWYVNNDRAITWVDGRLVRLQVATDISEMKHLERQVRTAQKMESIGNLAGGIAHDFNNILFPIMGMSEMLLEDLPAGSQERENATEILKAGKRGRDLVKQILAFSRQAGPKLAPTRVQKVLTEIVRLSSSVIPANIKIVQAVQEDCGFVMADASQIHQVAMNIITNAFHAIEPESGTITVGLKEVTVDPPAIPGAGVKPGKYALISVSDTGHGMDQEMIKNIFDPYFTTKEKGKGTGLGLAVVYGIVKEHRGHIQVESRVGEGTTFLIHLPLMNGDTSAGAGNGESTEVSPRGTERVLLVDDEPAIASLQQQVLERLGYRVTIRTSSLETLELFRARPDGFDLVISDMTMPVMTGDQLAREITAIRPEIPVIICTGFSERLTGADLDALGIAGVVMKPVVAADMARLIRKVLDTA